jgi:hypothetical protein
MFPLPMSAHRRIVFTPNHVKLNADKERTHLNRKLIEFPEGIDNRTQAVLHMDEKTPHIHATVVTIVTGERRKTKETKKHEEKPEQDAPGKKKYRKKSSNTTRPCADDIMTRDNLERFQDTYADKMSKYGLQRVIKGSDARHITTPQYYRDLYVKNEDLKEDIAELVEQKQEVYDKGRDLYDRKDEVREKFMNLHEYTQQKEQEIAMAESRLEQLKKDYEPYKAQEDMDFLFARTRPRFQCTGCQTAIIQRTGQSG